MSTVAILPVKRFGGAKQRLGSSLAGGTRRALAEAMVTDVLVALRRTEGVDEVLLVTAEPAAEAIGRGHGARVVADQREDGQSSAALAGVRIAMDGGARRALLVPGDCPALDPAELTELLATPVAGERSVVLVPDRHGTGTNALLLSPPDVFTPSFGPDSRARHERAAAEAGVALTVVQTPSLVLDVDTPEDLAALRDALATTRGTAAHTRGMLSRLKVLDARDPEPSP
jgi:2-phospho-L-lactate guanylyltransferase